MFTMIIDNFMDDNINVIIGHFLLPCLYQKYDKDYKQQSFKESEYTI